MNEAINRPATPDGEDVICATEGPIGRLRLHRPKALNALNMGMCESMLGALEGWAADGAVAAVMIDHAEGRGFCAGGDIRLLADSGAGDGAAARAFFFAEYRLNHRLFTFAKPTVAVMDGITMGGGVGLALPCRYRIATENTRLAMPETGIGLFPDVGGGWYLSRLPGRMGQYIALTGTRLNGADCLALGLATHHVAAATLPALKRALIERPVAEMASILDGMAEVPGEGTLAAHRDAIDQLFAADALEDILAALEAADSAFAAETLATLRSKSPQAMKVSLRLLHDGAQMASFADEMAQEYAVATRVVQRHDFVEGVRAVIVDKDHAPRWQPATAADVTDHVIDQIFAPLSADAAWSPA
ncbi:MULTISPECIES: enoyl-CoA hydratase/isomerase family protein [unclassified Sphingomonas]|uniref:enoyl-CoA hydratase/isomerase family protein n=1 Tax=unclassified Sphingomonas TaxID=196159 RepID=UPI00226A1838|nr:MULTISPECIES: enoyl-CoA hydratase/isomerase family protein [unclassified Sphingomonas]